jgi:hypothetical protein
MGAQVIFSTPGQAYSLGREAQGNPTHLKYSTEAP